MIDPASHRGHAFEFLPFSYKSILMSDDYELTLHLVSALGIDLSPSWKDGSNFIKLMTFINSNLAGSWISIKCCDKRLILTMKPNDDVYAKTESLARRLHGDMLGKEWNLAACVAIKFYESQRREVSNV